MKETTKHKLGNIGIVLGVIGVFGFAGFAFWYVGTLPPDFYAIRITHNGIGIQHISVQGIDIEYHVYKATDANGLAKFYGASYDAMVFIFTYNGTTYQYAGIVNKVVEDPI